MTFASALREVELADGSQHRAHIPSAKGHPGNPMTWHDMRHKFNGLVAPRLAEQTDTLFGLLREFGDGNSRPHLSATLSGL